MRLPLVAGSAPAHARLFTRKAAFAWRAKEGRPYAARRRPLSRAECARGAHHREGRREALRMARWRGEADHCGVESIRRRISPQRSISGISSFRK